MIVRESITAVALITLIIYRDPYLAAIGLIIMPISVIPFTIISRRLRKLGRRSQQNMADISIFLQEIFSGIKVLKAFSENKRNRTFCQRK